MLGTDFVAGNALAQVDRYMASVAWIHKHI